MKQVYLFKYGLTLLLLICAISVFAQNKPFTGKVVDETNQPLPGATVRIKGSDQTTSTDARGVFSFPNNGQSAIAITISFVGYDAMEKTITANDASVSIQLVPNQKALNEVVVVGYGTVRKTDLTGSVTNLSTKDLNPGPVTNPLEQLQGKAAGVNITQTGNEPGVPPTVRIRGITTLSSVAGGNDPLVVVDGIQGDMTLLNQVPPSEIEHVDILKDASATAIYGSRGAPGVIIVTTKRNAAGKSSVEYTENTSVDVISKKLDMLNASQWSAEASALGVDASANHGSNTDWFDLLTQTGVTQNHTLAFGAASNGFNYRASLSAIDQTGIVVRSNYKKYIGSIVATQKALDNKLTLTMNLNDGIIQTNYSPTGIGNAAFTSNTITQAYLARPTDPVYSSPGVYYTDANVFQYTNPYAVAETVSNLDNINNMFGSLKADLDIYKGLTAGWFGSWRKVDENSGYYLPAASQNTAAVEYNGIGNINNNHTDQKLMDIDLAYKHDFGKSHFDALVLYEWQQQTYNGNFTQMRDFPTDATTYNALQLGNIADFQNGDISSYKNQRTLVSFLGRVNYSYDNKYLLTASIRRDGSTVFGVNDKFGYFPSGSVAWRIDQEDFIKDQNVVSTLKLRGGYGETGNQQDLAPNNSIGLVGLNPTSPTVFFGGQTIPNYSATQNYNPNLRWETRQETNLGLDFGLFHDKLTGTFDAYTSKTINMLFNYTVPVEGDFLVNSDYGNAGTLQNQGLELSLNYVIIKTDKITFTLAGNGSLMQNKVLKLSGIIDGNPVFTNYQSYGGGGTGYLIVGKPIGTYLIYKHTGVDANGAETVAGVNSTTPLDPGVQSSQRYDAGQELPKYNYAFTPSFSYKNFDVAMVWRGAGGNKVYDGLREDLSLLENTGKQNVLASAVPLGIHSTSVQSDEWLESGNYLKFQNLTFGYRFNIPANKYVSSIRVNLTGQNLLTITKYKGEDPELDASGDSGSGSDYGIYPPTRTFSAGLNVILK